MLLTGQTEQTGRPEDVWKLYSELKEAVRRYVPSPEEMEEDDLSCRLIMGLAGREPENEAESLEAISLMAFLLEEHGWHEDAEEQLVIDGLTARAALVSPSPGRLRKSMLEQIHAFCGLEAGQAAAE
ncbi:hypothetical protein [Indiicoccus explosivorum]|uniref:hypothetical protein n=1 Tax=Indiicoccus explosivorum TaxID=1917864 RepID=UPI000B441620|nr:hypothetical protein [Indiicoccus explosivorum]